jgi:phosphoribosylformylglycinamidine synthase
MMAVVEPDRADKFLGVCAKWDVRAAVIGEVTDSGRLVMTWHGETVVDIPPSSAADGPVYRRPAERGADQDALAADDPDALPRPADGAAMRADLLALLGSAGLADKSWVTDQYDRYVRGDTVLAMPEDGGLIRVDEATGLGIALATDGNGRYCRLDPYLGTQLALGEAYRNVAVTGARPLAVTNCLNFGSPEDPAVMWQFAEAVRGLADGCATLGVPVTGGNVSFYNQTGTTPIHPTPVIGVLGVHDDVRHRLAIGFGREPDGEPGGPGAARAPGGPGAARAPGSTAPARIVLLGRTRAEFGGSAWAHVLYGHLGGRPPEPDLDAERRLADLLAAAAGARVLSAAHDLSDGGLAVALAESCLRGETGCVVTVPGDPFTWLFSESAGRAIVAVRPEAETAFDQLRSAHDVPGVTIGTVGGDSLVFAGLFTIGLDELAAVHTRTLPALFG